MDALRLTTNSFHNSDINTAGEGWEAVDAVRLDGWDQEPPPTVTIAAIDASAAENPLDGGTFTISRTDTNGDLTVLYDLAAPAMLAEMGGTGRVLVVINNGGGRIFGRLPRMPTHSPE